MSGLNFSALRSLDDYEQLYKQSLTDPERFWSAAAKQQLSWYKEWDSILTIEEGGEKVKWFEGGELNVSYNCIDRYVEAGHGERVAYYFESNEGEERRITYAMLLGEVSRFANVLKAQGVKKGDRVCIYMPMIPEAVYAMLACARIGAVHSVVFAGFSAKALQARIDDSGAMVLITADVVHRGEKKIPLYKTVADTLVNCSTLSATILIETVAGENFNFSDTLVNYNDARESVSDVNEPVSLGATDPFFILYTSGSTGKPKGVLHTVAGYALYVSLTHKYAFDLEPGDVFWCAADIGWITGHSYMVYGPLLNGASSVLFEGVPTYPTPSRYWEIVDKYHVTIFYSSPTAIRGLMAYGDEPVHKTSRKSLRILGTVGEPINPEAWRWYNEVVGEKRCHIVDTWWQTETGGHAILSLPHTVKPKPGAAMLPFFGIEPVVLDEEGNEMVGEAEGVLALKGEWPGKLVDLYNNHERYLETYLRPYPGYYFPGDGVRRDGDGHFWITGRIDDVLNVSGRLIGTAEVESALVLHGAVAEAAVVGIPHKVKGTSIRAYVVLMKDTPVLDSLQGELTEYVKKEVGSFAKPDEVIIVGGLPKTRSGKIMRRILRKIAVGETGDLGDTSTLADPSVVEALIKESKKE